MADKSGSPAFRPPMDHITENDPQIIRVPMDKTDWGFRKSQDPKQNHGATPNPKHIPNE
jgi:hypothetical protein